MVPEENMPYIEKVIKKDRLVGGLVYYSVWVWQGMVDSYAVIT